MIAVKAGLHFINCYMFDRNLSCETRLLKQTVRFVSACVPCIINEEVTALEINRSCSVMIVGWLILSYDHCS